MPTSKLAPRSRAKSTLPPAAELATYEQAFAGTADRILSMAERSQRAEIREARFEQWASFIIDIFGQLFLYGLVGAAVYLAINDKPLEAFFAGVAPIAIAIYANARKQRDQTDDKTPSTHIS